MVDAARPRALRAVVRPDPRQHLSRPAAVWPPASDRHLGRGRDHRRRPVRPGQRPRPPGQRDRRAVAGSPGRRRPPLLPRPARGRDREPAGHPGGHRPVAPPLRAQAPPRVDRHCRRQGNHPMTDHELEQRLRAWYRVEIPSDETAPADLRAQLAALPVAIPVPLRRRAPRRGLTLLAAAALLTTAIVGSALLTGSNVLPRLRAPVGCSAVVAPPSVAPPSGLPSAEAPTDRPVAGVIVYTRWKTLGDGEEDCRTTADLPPRHRLHLERRWLGRARSRSRALFVPPRGVPLVHGARSPS